MQLMYPARVVNSDDNEPRLTNQSHEITNYLTFSERCSFREESNNALNKLSSVSAPSHSLQQPPVLIPLSFSYTLHIAYLALFHFHAQLFVFRVSLILLSGGFWWDFAKYYSVLTLNSEVRVK